LSPSSHMLRFTFVLTKMALESAAIQDVAVVGMEIRD